jgi:hypothetical protein
MPDGFSAEQVRAAFLRFFVSIFRNYHHFINPIPPDTPPAPGTEAFNKEVRVRVLQHDTPTPNPLPPLDTTRLDRDRL